MGQDTQDTQRTYVMINRYLSNGFKPIQSHTLSHTKIIQLI
jgi:hypothetical protein